MFKSSAYFVYASGLNISCALKFEKNSHFLDVEIIIPVRFAPDGDNI